MPIDTLRANWAKIAAALGLGRDAFSRWEQARAVEALIRQSEMADRVQHLRQVGAARTPRPARARQERFDPLPFLIGQIGRVTFRLPFDPGHPASRALCPHGQGEARKPPNRNPHSQTVSQVSGGRTRRKRDRLSARSHRHARSAAFALWDEYTAALAA